MFKIIDNDFTPPRVSVIRTAVPEWTKEQCEREIEIARCIGQLNAGPKVLHVSSDSRCMHMEYMNGNVQGPDSSIDFKEFTETLQNFHSLGILPVMAQDGDSEIFRLLHEQIQMIKNMIGILPPWLEALYSKGKEKEEILKGISGRTLCHLNPHCFNIMRHEGRMVLIDYTMSGKDHPFFDLATFAMYWSLSPEKEINLLSAYIGKEADKKIIDIYAFFRPLVYLNKVTWPLIGALNQDPTPQKHATLALIESVFAEPTVVDLKDILNKNDVSDDEKTPVDLLRIARSAYEQFYRKNEGFLQLV